LLAIIDVLTYRWTDKQTETDQNSSLRALCSQVSYKEITLCSGEL